MFFGEQYKKLNTVKHYYIVLNHENSINEYILAVVATSNVSRYENGLDLGILSEEDFHIIEATSKENNFFPKDTVIECDKIFSIGEINLIDFEFKHKINPDILKKIKAKVQKNKKIPKKYKKKI